MGARAEEDWHSKLSAATAHIHESGVCALVRTHLYCIELNRQYEEKSLAGVQLLCGSRLLWQGLPGE
jgi:hypothetical protein